MSINGHAMLVERQGEGSPLVLIHGVGADYESWDGVVQELGAGIDIIRYDQRGHGQSFKPPGAYHLDDFVEDLKAVMDSCRIACADIAGFSLGGLVGQDFALKYPARVNRLVLISTVAGRTEEERCRVMARARKLRDEGAESHLNDAVDRWFTDAFIAARPDVLEWRRQKSMRNDPVSYAAAYQVLASSDLAQELHRIMSPTLVMTGECDIGSTPRMARLIANRVGNGRYVIFPHLKHSVLLEAPDQVAREMKAFFSEEGG